MPLRCIPGSYQESTLKDRKHLSIAYKPGHTEIIPATISLWIAKTVCCAYHNLPEDSAHLFRVWAHDVWAFATSWNALQKVSVQDILCGSVAFPHHLHLLLPHQPHSRRGRYLLNIGLLDTAQQVTSLPWYNHEPSYAIPTGLVLGFDLHWRLMTMAMIWT